MAASVQHVDSSTFTVEHMPACSLQRIPLLDSYGLCVSMCLPLLVQQAVVRLEHA
jgi:hypothetical protein